MSAGGFNSTRNFRSMSPRWRIARCVNTQDRPLSDDWLSGLPFVDPQRIGFYGRSYGGKTAKERGRSWVLTQGAFSLS